MTNWSVGCLILALAYALRRRLWSAAPNAFEAAFEKKLKNRCFPSAI